MPRPGKPLAHAACVELEGDVFGNAGLGHVAIGACCGRKGEKRRRDGEGAQGFATGLRDGRLGSGRGSIVMLPHRSRAICFFCIFSPPRLFLS